MELLGAILLSLIVIAVWWCVRVWRRRVEDVCAVAESMRSKLDEARRDADYYERLARDYRAGMEAEAAEKLREVMAREKDLKMIRHLEAELKRERGQ